VKKIYLLIPLFLFVCFFPVVRPIPDKSKPEVKAFFSQSAPLPQKKDNSSQLSLTATGVFVMDLKSGVVLYDKNPHKRLKPASLTKIMTSLVALDYYKDDSVLKVINAQKSLGNTIDLLKGDQLLASDVILGLLISSGNDAAVTLAENYPGGYKSFVEKMNAKTLELGLENTKFSNVSGVESADHYTTAYDIAAIARAALDRPTFENIVSKKKATLKSLNGHIYNINTTNILLGKPGFYGVKTGWTPQAGECLVVLAEKDAHPILISILNSQDRFGEAQKIYKWVFDNYTWE